MKIKRDVSIYRWIINENRSIFKKKYKPILSRMTMSYVQTPKINKLSLWISCENCGTSLHKKTLRSFLGICMYCGYHFQLTSDERISLIIDKRTWKPYNDILSPCDPLKFHDKKSYKNRLRSAQRNTALLDGVQTGTGVIQGIHVALGVMDFNFMGGSMGSVIGEKLTRIIEHAIKRQYHLIIVSASGGARMQEGVLSLMQMAKISAALYLYQNVHKFIYISICTSPTTGGITASFAMLGTIILAEPGALIGFAGRRVIAGTLNEELPEGFQTSEYLLKYGQLDAVISRYYMKEALVIIFRMFSKAYFKSFQYSFTLLNTSRVQDYSISYLTHLYKYKKKSHFIKKLYDQCINFDAPLKVNQLLDKSRDREYIYRDF